MNPLSKLIAATLTILTCAGLSTLALASTAAASSPVAREAHARHHRSQRLPCPATKSRRHHARGCTAQVHRARVHSLHARTLAARRAKTHSTSIANGQVLAAQQRAAALAAALSAPCANTELTPTEGNVSLVRAAVLCLINRERAQNGLAPLTVNVQLEAAAESHCSELIADDYFAHVSPSGETPVDRIRATGYIPAPSDGYVIGENLAWGTYSLATAQSIVSAWIASPGHLANILEAKYTETGIAIATAVPASLANGAPGATYAQEFGVIVP